MNYAEYICILILVAALKIEIKKLERVRRKGSKEQSQMIFLELYIWGGKLKSRNQTDLSFFPELIIGCGVRVWAGVFLFLKNRIWQL